MNQAQKETILAYAKVYKRIKTKEELVTLCYLITNVSRKEIEKLLFEYSGVI